MLDGIRLIFSISRRRPSCSQLFMSLVATGIAIVLTACGASDRSFSSASAAANFSGIARGGQQPISNAAIQLYAMSTLADGAAAIPMLATPVLTGSDGRFSVTGTYTCPSASSQMYLVASGGNPGLSEGSNNANAALMTLLGPCGNLSNSTHVVINEITTIASVYALSSFMTSYQEVGSSSSDVGSLTYAVSIGNELADFATGTTPGPALPNGATAPVQKLITLADILAACVNSSGGTAGDSTACGKLFSQTSDSQGFPTDTIAAALSIAQSPTQNVAPIFELSTPITAFAGSLTVAPDDWTLQITSSVPSPNLSPAPGTFNAEQYVTLSETAAAAKMYYTTDGSAPSTSSTLYSGPVPVSASSTIRAIAVAGGISSLPTVGTYVISPVNVSMSPAAIVLSSSQTEAFTATVSGSSNTAVTWSLRPAVGTMSPTGLYAAPASVVAAQTIMVTATSAVEPSVSTSATVSLVPPVSVALTPASVTLAPSATQAFIATVSNGSNAAVTWAISGAGCNGSSCGTISSSGLYTAPASVPTSATITITVSSVSNPTQSASASVTIVPAQAAGYSLAWQDTFSPLNITTSNTAGSNWYDPGLWNFGTYGAITNPTGYANLNWVSSQVYSTNMSTCFSYGVAPCRSWAFGYFEASMAFNDVTGNWPVVWLQALNYNRNMVHTGPELDIFEWQSNTPSVGYSTLHTWVNGTETGTNSGSNSWTLPRGTVLSKFNTYGALWTATSISWYFNDTLVETIDTTAAPYNTQFNGQYPMFFAFLESAGCNWVLYQTSPCSGQASPLNMQVQWVHVYTSH